MSAARSVRRSALAAVVAAALAAIVVPAAAPLAGTRGLAAPARAAEPAGPAADQAAVELVPQVIRHGPRTERVVALTFDDGWSPATLREIYRILVRERVPATFFVTGIYVQRAPALWRQIAAAGFPLANHSYLHRDTRGLAPRAVAKDLALTRKVVESATGQAMLPYYRPPYGARNPSTDRLAAAAGFPYIILWDTTAADTTPSPTVAAVVRTASAGRSGSIVLLHAGPGVTPRALPSIIALYRARGFRFVTVPEMLGAPRLGPSPATELAPGPVPAPPRPAILALPSRSIDREGSDARPAPTAAPLTVVPVVPVVAAGGHAVPPREGDDPPPPARAAPIGDPRPPARDAAWARRGGAPGFVAGLTVVSLVILLGAAALAGRRRRTEDDVST